MQSKTITNELALPKVLILFFLVAFVAIGLSSQSIASFSLRGAVSIGVLLPVVLFVFTKFKWIPSSFSCLLYFSRSLALAFCFPCPAVFMLAATLALLKGHIGYFSKISEFEADGRRRLLFDLGLVAYWPDHKFGYSGEDISLIAAILCCAGGFFFVPNFGHGISWMAWLAIGGFVGLDLESKRLHGALNGG